MDRPGGYVPDLNKALGRHPGTDIVWCHAGASRSIEPESHARLVADLHIDLSGAWPTWWCRTGILPMTGSASSPEPVVEAQHGLVH